MLKVVRHIDLNIILKKEIVDIKSISWSGYTFNEHLKWMDNNLLKDDLHFLKYDNEGVIESYVNLVEVSLMINGVNTPVLGVGNVCARTKGQGDGGKLMQDLNNYIVKMNKIGLLFCKDHLISFYNKYNWHYLEYKLSNISALMVFNLNVDIEEIEYNDRKF